MRIIALFCFWNFFSLQVSEADENLARRLPSDIRKFKVGISWEGVDANGKKDSKAGSGFIRSLSKGIIWTNKHVMETKGSIVQKIMIEFSTAEGRPQDVEAEILFISPLYDFAALRFDPKKLGRAKGYVTEGPIPTAEEYHKRAHQGADVVAYGDPLDNSDIATYGKIINRALGSDWGISNEISWEDEAWIMTDAPVSAGNSGGPLVHKETGVVLGIVTQTAVDGQNLNDVLPIPPLLEEAERFEVDPNFAEKKDIVFDYRVHGEKDLKTEGLISVIEKEIPEAFKYYAGFLMIHWAPPLSKLQVGDIILRIDGEPIGDNSKKMDKIFQTTLKKILELKVLRAKKVVKLRVPLINFTEEERIRDSQSISFSGLVFKDILTREVDSIFNGQPAVQVSKILPGSEIDKLDDELKIYPETILTSIQIGGVPHPVENLRGLGRILKGVKRGTVIRLNVNSPLALPNNKEGKDDKAGNNDEIARVNDEPVIQRHSRLLLVRLDNVVIESPEGGSCTRALKSVTSAKKPLKSR